MHRLWSNALLLGLHSLCFISPVGAAAERPSKVPQTSLSAEAGPALDLEAGQGVGVEDGQDGQLTLLSAGRPFAQLQAELRS
jgi:hypothetical protein